MRKLLFLFLLFPFRLFGQEYLKFPTTYNSEGTAKEICKGEVKRFLSDTVEWKVEKKNDRWVTSWISPGQVGSKIDKIFSKGIPAAIATALAAKALHALWSPRVFRRTCIA